MRNANNYSELSGAPISADVQAYLFSDLVRIKSDVASVESRISESVAETNQRTDNLVQTIYDRIGEEIRALSTQYRELLSAVSSSTTLTKQQAELILECRKRIDELSVAVAVLDTIEGRFASLEARFNTKIMERVENLTREVDLVIQNKMLSQQNQDNNEIPRSTLRDLPGKVTKLDERLAALERRMWLLQIVGGVLAGGVASFGKELFSWALRK